MTEPFREMAELRGLLDALCEETITAEQMRRLEELVLTHPEAEAHYVQYLSLYADLVRHFAASPAPAEQTLRERLGAAQPEAERGAQAPKSVVGLSAPAGRRRRFLLWGTFGVAGLAAGLLLVLAQGHRPTVDATSSNPAAEATDETVAVLLQAPGAEWDEVGQPPRIGSPLLPGWLRLKSGFAHVEFYNGATVILQGPAELQLISRSEAYCARGKLRATVPPQAQGFRINTPKLDLVDRGTEFGLQVDAADKTEIHVFQGKVELYDAASNRQPPAPKELTTGQGVRLDGPDGLRPIKTDPNAFRTAQDLEARQADEAQRRQRAWLTASEAVRRDPSLLVYYTFQAEPGGGRTLLDQASERKQPHDGAIVGCRWGVGRWPGKKGLEFKQVSDRVRIHVPGDWDSITLAAWVRVDALPNLNNSLMMAQGWPEGGIHWQIGEAGKLILAVKAPDKVPNAHYHALGIFTPERLGRWTHLAAVYDRDAGQVTQYVDGRLVAQEPVLLEGPLRIGDAELGNWNVNPFRSAQPIRHLSGCMDEFMLFSRALSGEEIERLYSQGQPPL
jgi:hypothetical protein